MLHRVACVLILSAFMFLPTAIRAQDASRDVVGVWKVIGAETKEVVSGKVAKPFGDYPIGTFFFSRGGRMAGMLFGANRKTAAGANATDAERAALFASMSAYSGIYKVDGKKLLVAIENSSVQSWNGTQRIFNIEIAGGKLTGTSDPFKSLTSGLDVVAVVTWEKVE